MIVSRSDERGVAVVWALALVSVLLLVGMVSAGVAAQAVTRQRVVAVADVAALAAAQALIDPCGRAARVADQNQMALTQCTSEGLDVVVQVSAPAPGTVVRLLSLLGRGAEDVRALARAGAPE